MEAETTESVTETSAGSGDSVPSTDDFGAVLSRCGLCKEQVQNRRPKLLSCLHTFCQQCVSSLETGESMFTVLQTIIITDRVSGQGNAVGRVCPLFSLYLLNFYFFACHAKRR